ncbi:MAG: short-chain dehydrogenase [Candidatus Pacebacteria bacterium CG10_big_fil_rev_8_21_14_0_10_42_12]|nr:MAG: short-chain dehydrogenase [Candidatus Pacebacteria bacterium CG10_big_fil_rev_8_21_14_0_10_42_12]
MNKNNKVAIVTGGAMGYKSGGKSIGGSVAIQLARDGYKVVVVDLGEMGERTAEIIRENGGEAIFCRKDVTVVKDVKSIVATAVDKFGGVSALVNCVALYSPGMAKNIAEISEEDWQQTLNVNLNGYFLMSKYAIPEIIKSGNGSIVNISSIESFIALPNFSVYSVSKGAIDALTRSLATDFAPKIRINSVLPGFVKIANSENNRSADELKKWYASVAKQYPMKRVCETDEIANVVSFLVSDKASYINGQSIVVDGGKSVADFHEF